MRNNDKHYLQQQANHTYSLDDLTRHAKECGSHFFDADTMRYFRSRLCHNVTRVYRYSGVTWQNHTGRDVDGFLFITSERHEYQTDAGFHQEPRRYTVRLASFDFDHIEEYPQDGDHDSFQYFDTLRQAIAFYERMVKSWRKEGKAL